MKTEVRRIVIVSPTLEQDIKDTCANLAGVGYHLAGCFAAGSDLVLVFQK
jgi:hypothetical protein